MSRVVISVMKDGKDVKALSYDDVRSVIIINGGRRYVITPTRINVDNASNGSNVIRVRTKSGVHDLPIDWDSKYIIVWYNKDDEVIAHANIDGRFMNATIRAWP